MVGPKYNPPDLDIQTDWKNESDQEVEFQAEIDFWWEVFEDEKLNELEELAVSNNKSLFAAYERIQEARYRAGIVGADLLPQFSLDPQYNNQEILIKTFAGTNAGSLVRAHELIYSLPINLSFQLDLFGRLRSRYYAAKYTWEAQIEDYKAVLLTLTTDLAMTFYQLRVADSQIDLLDKTIKTREKAFEINKARYDASVVNFSDVSRAGLEVENAKLQFFEVLRQREVLENRIAVLLGLNASEFYLDHYPLEDLPPRIPVGLPSDIIMQRPDIAEVERQMASAHALVKAAYASFFPSIELTAGFGFISPVFREFLKHRSLWWMYGSDLDQTIFDGYRKADNLGLQYSTFRELSYQYQDTVLRAFEEVENALNDIEEYTYQFENSEKAVYWARKTTTISKDRYFQGVTFYLDVMDSERDQLQAEIIWNELRGLRFIATIDLIRAIGGIWKIPCCN